MGAGANADPVGPPPIFDEAATAARGAGHAAVGIRTFTCRRLPIRATADDYTSYAKRVGGAATGAVVAAAAWRQVASIGGENGYFYLDWLWRVRELMDAAVGGNGAVRMRRTARVGELCCGDRVDSWQVLRVDPERRLALGFGMKAPGAGVLEFLIQPLAPTRTRVAATAYWQPAGLPGLLYWYALAPAHLVIFDGLTREIVRRAASDPARGARAAVRAGAE